MIIDQGNESSTTKTILARGIAMDGGHVLLLEILNLGRFGGLSNP
jgi:hypothetical protein